jgi:uncharacterized protein YsxB (DUF464 family)
MFTINKGSYIVCSAICLLWFAIVFFKKMRKIKRVVVKNNNNWIKTTKGHIVAIRIKIKKKIMNKVSKPFHSSDINYKTYSFGKLMG